MAGAASCADVPRSDKRLRRQPSVTIGPSVHRALDALLTQPVLTTRVLATILRISDVAAASAISRLAAFAARARRGRI